MFRNVPALLDDQVRQQIQASPRDLWGQEMSVDSLLMEQGVLLVMIGVISAFARACAQVEACTISRVAS